VPLADAELAADLLLSAGATAVEERADGDRMILIADPDRTRLPALDAGWVARWVPVDDSVLDTWRDWAEPVRAGRIVVHPAWLPPQEQRDGDIVIVVDPGRAFGSGSHPSTRLALAALERHVRPGDTVLDVGCGSGVLAIAAALLGASRVHAVDIDPLAIVVTAANAARNGVTVHTRTAPADLVVANIGAAALTELAPTIDGATVVLSGLLAEQADAVVAAYVDAGYDEIERPQEDGWVAPVLHRRTSTTAATGTRP
jgi:ribosomal protein L11 methyltransferase